MKTTTLFDGSVRLAHFGVAAGNFSPRHTDWTVRHRAAAEALGLGRQVRLKVDFSAVLAGEIEPVDGPVWQTCAVAEGMVLAPGVGAAITSADCCTGVLWNGTEAVAMHLGLGCVHRDGPTIVERAAARLGGDLRLWLGAAIGPCCYGFPERDEAERARVDALRARWGDQAVPGRVKWGPRKGWAAIDHVAIAAAHARSLGIAVEIEGGCTACSGLDDPDVPGYGDFYSNTRDINRGFERNLVVVYQ